MRILTPTRRVHLKPAFWGVDRDLKEVMDNMENIWEGSKRESHNFKETEKAYLLSIEIPGVSKSSLELHQEDELLTIKGKKSNAFFDEEATEEAEVLKTVAIPQLCDKEKIEAHLEDGILYLALPKLEKAVPRKIDISETTNSNWKNLLK